MSWIFRIFCLCFSITLTISCQPEKPLYEDHILVLGHTYRWGAEIGKVDEQLEHIDYGQFNEVWLLGDVCAATDREESHLQYLDSLFGLSEDRVKWAIGNHDIRDENPDLIKKYTGKEFFYGSIQDNYAVYVLNSQAHYAPFKDSCDFFARQDEDFRNFLKRIQSMGPDQIHSLFVLSHNPVWSDTEASLEVLPLIGNAAAGWIDLVCLWNGEFRNQYFDTLAAIQKQGIQVHCVAGDGGQYAKKFYHEGASGIKYYVTGINNSVLKYSDERTIKKFNTNPDSVLLFRKTLEGKSFTGEFIPLDKL